MLSYEDALARVLSHAAPLNTIAVALDDALGRVLAAGAVSPFDFPMFDNSQMDGCAVRASDLAEASAAHPVELPVAGISAAGNPLLTALPAHTAVKIFTGAMMPPGADTVVPVEDVAASGQSTVSFRAPARHGDFVRRKGEDITTGAIVLPKGRQIGSGELALAASFGYGVLQVVRPPRVLLLSVGDELVAAAASEQTLKPGQIFESNSVMLYALIRQAGVMQCARRTVRDTPEDLNRVLDEFFGPDAHKAATPDVVISSGGVSVGDFDFVRDVLSQRGAIDFWKAAIRPGKPFAFGSIGDSLFFGLPGNPASAFVTFELFVRPVLRKLQGAADYLRLQVEATLLEPAAHEPGRRSFQRAVTQVRHGRFVTTPLKRQGSHIISSLSDANSLVILPEDRASFPVGGVVSAMLVENCL